MAIAGTTALWFCLLAIHTAVYFGWRRHGYWTLVISFTLIWIIITLIATPRPGISTAAKANLWTFQITTFLSAATTGFLTLITRR